MAANPNLRESRYKILRSAGFTATEARKLRDRKPATVEAALNERQASIKRIPTRRRTKMERENLASIKQHKSDVVESRTAISTRSDRLEQFSTWSTAEGFPDDVLKYIRKINRAAGKRPRNSYGYRVFYHEFVFGRSRQVAMEVVERRDT